MEFRKLTFLFNDEKAHHILNLSNRIFMLP